MPELYQEQNESNEFESDFNLIQFFDLLYKIDVRLSKKKKESEQNNK